MAGIGFVALLACGTDPAAPRGVVARLGGGGARSAEALPPVTTRPFKVTDGTRQLVESASFEVAVPDSADRVAWSEALFAPPGAKGRFEVRVRDGAKRWSSLDARVLAPSTKWNDFERPLPAGRNRVLNFDAATLRYGAEPLWGSILFQGALAPPSRPNVLLISLDTLGADHLGSFQGPEGVSPNLDRWLENSASFRRSYAQYGSTLASHASIFSALYPVHHQMFRSQPSRLLRTSLVRTIADAGYHTAAFTEGGFVGGGYGFAVGFDRYEEGNPHFAEQMNSWADKTFDAAARWLEALAPQQQYFLFVHTYEVHSPYLPRDADASTYANRLTPGDEREFSASAQFARMMLPDLREHPSPRDLDRLEALYHSEIRSLDALLGDFLRRIEPRTRNTVIVLLSDHGEQFGEWGRVGHGDSLHDRVIHVPLAFRGPGIVPRVFDTPTQLVDVMPTILDLLGLPVSEPLDGRSLAPVLRDPSLTLEPRPAYAEQRTTRQRCRRDGVSSTCPVDRVAVIDGRFKLVDERSPDSQRLYDLRGDPLETRDVAQEHPEEVARLRALASAYRQPDKQKLQPVPEPADAPAPDEDMLRQLQALGYEVGGAAEAQP